MQKKSITIVCFANYCRSPVAEALLNLRFGDHFSFNSAGIKPFESSGMDPRSGRFLKERFNIEYPFHVPKIINKRIIESSFMIFAMDHIVLTALNQKYFKYSKKIKVINFLSRKVNIPDPYNFEINDYFEVLERIESVINEIDLESLWA